MFLFKKIISALLLPPGIFILALLALGFWIPLKKRWHGQWSLSLIIFFIAAIFWIFSIAPMADFLTKQLEGDLKAPRVEGISKTDSLILLGGGASADAPDFFGAGVPSKDMLVRIVAAVRLQKKIGTATTALPIIISGAPGETLISQKFLIDLGAPSSSIILEKQSRDTISNAENTKVILEKYGFKNPTLVTSAFHMKRAILSFQKIGVSVIAAPADLKNFNNKKYFLLDYFPSVGALKDSAIALREYLGFIFYETAY